MALEESLDLLYQPGLPVRVHPDVFVDCDVVNMFFYVGEYSGSSLVIALHVLTVIKVN